MKKYLGLILLVSSLAFTQEALNFSNGLSVKISSGINHYPLKEWNDFVGHFENYEQDAINILGSINLTYHIHREHSIFFETEYLTTQASDKDNIWSSLIWDFEGIPLTLGYQYKMDVNKDKITPFFSFGFSYFFSKLTASLKVDPDITPSLTDSKTERQGEGYGYYGELGLIYKISNSIFTSISYRARYSDGMYFTDKDGAIPVEFTSHGLNIGIGYYFKLD